MSTDNLHLVLVDDNEIDLFLHEKLIRIGNISNTITKFTSGQAALDALRGGKLNPDIILLDIQMPEMDGFEFLDNYEKLLGNKDQDTSIFMVSSSLDFGDINKAKANPFVSEFLKKPLNLLELKKVLQEAQLIT